MRRIEALALVAAGRLYLTDLLAVRVVVVRGVLALALEVLSAEDRNVAEHLALAAFDLAVHLPCFNVVEIVLFEAVPAEAL